MGGLRDISKSGIYNLLPDGRVVHLLWAREAPPLQWEVRDVLTGVAFIIEDDLLGKQWLSEMEVLAWAARGS